MQSETHIKNSLGNPRDPIDVDGEKLALFSGKIVRKNGALAFHGLLAQFFLTVAMGKAVWLQKVGEQEEVCVGVRAKYIRTGDGSANDVITGFGKIEHKFFDGLNERLQVRLGKERIILKAGDEIEYKAGDSVRLHFSRSNAVLFRCSPDSFKREAVPLALAML